MLSFVLLASVCACGSDARYCKLGETHIVATTREKLIDGVALAALEKGALLVWSDAAGTHAQRVDAGARAVGVTQRITERCDAGLALLAPKGAEAAVLACARRAAAGDVASRGEVELLDVAGAAPSAPLATTRRARFEAVGTLSEGVAIARGPRSLALAFHDASPDGHRVFLVPDIDARSASPELVSDPARMAFSPSLAFHQGELFLAFAERVTSGDDVRTVLRVQRGRAAPVELELRAHLAALPELASLGERLLLGYRSPGSSARKPGLYIAPLEPVASSSLRALSPLRVGRADGVGHPRLVPCLQGLVSATPRSYSGDYFIGINWLSPTLARPRREQQFYEDARAFTHAAIACLGPGDGDRALFALAELPQLDRAEAALHAATYACE